MNLQKKKKKSRNNYLKYNNQSINKQVISTSFIELDYVLVRYT